MEDYTSIDINKTQGFRVELQVSDRDKIGMRVGGGHGVNSVSLRPLLQFSSFFSLCQ